MRKQRWWLAVTCAAVLGLAGCSDQSAPQSSEAGAGQETQTDPYAGGKSYPWSDRIDPSGDAASVPGGFPWTGFHAQAGGLRTAAVGSGDTAYLSDLSWTSAKSAWGPVEKDMSNGDQGSGDGHPLTIGGQVYAKGLGVHASSEINYALNGLCTTFSASIGVDDEVGTRGSVVFEVWNGTATKLYSSALLTGNDPASAISVDVTNVQNLRLVVTDGGNGINNDHADWADAQIVCPQKPLSGQTYLSDLMWTSAQSGWGPIERDLSNGDKLSGDGHPLTIGGQVYAKGLGVHALSTITYALSAQCSAFDAQVGLDDEVTDHGSVVFQVFGDGVSLFDSGVLRGTDAPRALSVNLSGVQELKLVVGDSGNGITNDHADWGDAKLTCSTHTTAPATPTNLTALPGTGSVTLDWSDNTESDLVGYRVSRAAQASGPYTLLTAQPITVSAYTDASAGSAQVFYQVVAVDRSGNASAPASISATPSSGTPKIVTENPDAFPYPDRLVFSRIGSLSSPPSNAVHDLSTLRVKNTGTGPLTITGLNLTGTWVLDPAIPLPTNVAAGGTLNVRLRLTAQTNKVNMGTLTVVSNDPTTPNLTIQLAGLWQSLPENNQEPNPLQIRDAFGYTFSFLGGESSLNQDGLVRPQGDEVIAPYWQRADLSQPVTVRQIAAFHTQGNTGTLYWHDKASSSVTTLFTHIAADAQTIFPRIGGGLPAVTTFTPTATFGLRVDGEWSDPRRNSQTADRSNGCARPCGQHLRFWPIKDRAGALVPNSYMLIMDYSGINYDYNDMIYVISNVRPAPILLNVGGATYSAPSGDVWLSDKDQNGDAPYTPSTAVAQGSQTSTTPIAGTDNPVLYRTSRGDLGAATPQSSRLLTFNVPINNGTYLVKLHFADLTWTAPGQRVFDVSLEGQLRIASLDIVATAGGGNTALVVPIDNVQVKDGKLTIDLKASVDFPSLSGIEIVR
ncbi:NPCBM/NEW2 domain-containing protein (plasmid) [Deinococcus sp. KNUC1210]|uniref:NPCBM/NEW2 domain-containing protein n=1 Tax=Deinococcus sp. KNUC1210 TaxID=2917691 RepID=UPI001EF0D623|nr:NPCBM/NEW2 domain-containing protein [Deinococcus sp. KNUC1210]ULH17594.1 NPCBM/NEW2 domain-containing protein [Deinococcus sp. KNUC1210]